MGNWLQNSAYAVVTALVLSSGIPLCLAQQPGDLPPPATAPAILDQSAAEPKLITQSEILAPQVADRRLREVQFDGTPFEEVINRLRDATGANMLVIWKHIDQAGIDRKTPVQLRLHDVKLSKVLDEVFRQVNSDPTNRVGYIVEDGVITISTQAEVSNNIEARLYDVADLAAEGGDAENGLDDVSDIIMNTVEVNSWETAGGTGSIIAVYPRGRLLINQTPEVHRKVVALLRLLRRSSPQFTIELCLLRLDPAALPASLQRMLPDSDSDEGQSIGEQEKASLLRAAKSTTTDFPPLHAISGQSARLRLGTDVSYIAGASEGRGYPSVVTDGTTITVRPSVSPEGGPTTMAIEYKMTHLEKMEQTALHLDPNSTQTTTVQLPRMAVAEVSATAAIEDGKAIIVAVPELESSSGVKAQRATGRRTYLLLTPHQHLLAAATTTD